MSNAISEQHLKIFFSPPTLASANNKCVCWAKSQLKASLLGKPRDHQQLRQIYIYRSLWVTHVEHKYIWT